MARSVDADGVVAYTGWYWQLAKPRVALPVLGAVVAGGLFYACALSGDAWPIAAAPIGFWVWTFCEYAMHRWLMHEPKRPVLREIWLRFHKDHHLTRRMDDAEHRSLHPFIAVPVLLAVATFGVFAGGPIGLGIAAGWALGYATYEGIHAVQHTTTLFQRYAHLPWVGERYASHISHHLHHPRMNYGFVTSFWDKALGTYRPLIDGRVPSKAELLERNGD